MKTRTLILATVAAMFLATAAAAQISPPSGGGAAISVKGAYNGATSYVVGDLVTYDGWSYLATAPSPAGTLPTDVTKWAIIGKVTTGFASVSVGVNTWTSGAGAPGAACTAGDFYSRTNGTTGSTLYACTAANTWTAVENVTTWTTVPFNAGDFTGDGAMTWTVEAGDIVAFRYRRSGDTIEVNFSSVTTSVGGVPDGELRVKIPGGFTASTYGFVAAYVTDNSTGKIGTCYTAPATTYVTCLPAPSGGNWAAAANTTGVNFMMRFQIQ